VFLKSVNNSQSYHTSSAQLCRQELVEQLQHFKTFMFYTVQRGSLKNGNKVYIYFLDNLLMFPRVKEFSK